MLETAVFTIHKPIYKLVYIHTHMQPEQNSNLGLGVCKPKAAQPSGFTGAVLVLSEVKSSCGHFIEKIHLQILPVGWL